MISQRKPALPPSVCRGAFPADPDFPQLELAADPARMLELLRRHLRPSPGRATRIEACVPYRFRCRQSQPRCVLQYTLTLFEPETGRRWNQWVTGLIHAGRGEGERLRAELTALAASGDAPQDWLTLEPVAWIADLNMVLLVFPCDRKLPHLGRVLGGVPPGLASLLLAGMGPGGWRPEPVRIEPTRYRTELGAALKCTLPARETLSGRRRTRACYLKVYRHERREAFRQLQRLHERAEARRGDFFLAKPIACLDDGRTVALDQAPGRSVQRVLLRGGNPADALGAVARAVAAFNQGDMPIARVHSFADQCADIERASSLVQWACPETRARVRALAGAVTAGLHDGPLSPIHRDLKTDHIFLADERVIFIDLDSIALGDPVRDPAHLWAHLVGRVGLDGLAKSRADAAAALFLAEYFERVPRSWRRRFRFHCAGALIEVAGGIFKRQEPGWRQRVPGLIQEAQEALSGGLR